MTTLAMLMLIAATGAAGMADDAAVQAMQSHEALVTTSARTAAILCPGAEVDEAAIRERMAMAGITDRDIMSPDRFGSQDEAVAREFKAEAAANPGFCAAVLVELADRLRLLRRR